jgi:hypothetical protein
MVGQWGRAQTPLTEVTRERSLTAILTGFGLKSATSSGYSGLPESDRHVTTNPDRRQLYPGWFESGGKLMPSFSVISVTGILGIV